LHFFGDFQEIPSICFITRWARWGSFQNGFVKGKHVSFLIDSRTPRRGSIDPAHLGPTFDFRAPLAMAIT